MKPGKEPAVPPSEVAIFTIYNLGISANCRNLPDVK
jgi:hypothetical protein